MIINKTNKRVRRNYPLTSAQLTIVENYVTTTFINPMVKGQFYAVRDVFGGINNRDWLVQHPTLGVLYLSRCSIPTQTNVDKNAHRLAAQDLGHIIFNLLDQSPFLYEQRKSWKANEYKLL